MPIRRLKNRSTSPELPTVKNPAFSRKNGPLLREEQGEPIEVHLLIVDFDLRKVGVDSGVKREAWRDAVFHIAANVVIHLGVDRRDARLQRVAQPERRDAEIAQCRRLHAGHRASQRQTIEVELPGNRRPKRALVLAADVALEVDAPRLIGARGIPQRAERDRELGGPALIGGLRAHLPRRVPVDVESSAAAARLHLAAALTTAALAFVGDLGVVLDAGRIGAEHEPVLTIAIGVHDHLEAVGVVQRRIAARVRHDDAGRIAVVHDRTDIERVVGEDHADLGPLGHRLTLVGLLLGEPGDRSGLRPGRIAEDVTIERRRLWRARRGGDIRGRGRRVDAAAAGCAAATRA